MEKIERWKQRGTLAIRLLLLTIAGIFTIFPFVWMIVSALKTKAEIMDTSLQKYRNGQTLNRFFLIHHYYIMYGTVYLYQH